MLFAVQVGDLFEGEGLVARGTQRFSRLRLRLSREWNFQSWKTLRKFLKSFFSFKCSSG